MSVLERQYISVPGIRDPSVEALAVPGIYALEYRRDAPSVAYHDGHGFLPGMSHGKLVIMIGLRNGNLKTLMGIPTVN